ncbi:MAG: hypothetical protein C0391_03815 [Anaerolinea sp.]|nr:hypothetical protein [Anaerolinea sp.]
MNEEMILDQDTNPPAEKKDIPIALPKPQFHVGEELVWKGVPFKLALINHNSLVIKLVDGAFQKEGVENKRRNIPEGKKRHKVGKNG